MTTSDMSSAGDRPIDDGVGAARLGRRRFLAGAGATVGVAAIAVTVPDGVAHAAIPAGASRFVSLPTAVRLVDTRKPAKYDYSSPAKNRIRIALAGEHGVSPDASAAVLTVTAVNGGGPTSPRCSPRAARSRRRAT